MTDKAIRRGAAIACRLDASDTGVKKMPRLGLYARRKRPRGLYRAGGARGTPTHPDRAFDGWGDRVAVLARASRSVRRRDPLGADAGPRDRRDPATLGAFHRRRGKPIRSRQYVRP